jgi:4-hydroxybenzoate polyprenyltransferase
MIVRTLRALLKTMRPKQWAKNGFIFAAIIFDRQLLNLPELARTTAGFLLFCLIAGTVYILNDLSDVSADRLHPRKKLRPIASGALPERVAWGAVIVLALVALPLSFWLEPLFGLLAVGYYVMNFAYTKWLKNIPIMDVMVLASFYVLRVAAGVVMIQVTRFSPWLYVFTTFIALFLGVGKRRAELALLAGDANSHRKVLQGYSLRLLDQMITIVSNLTIITYSLYTFSAPNLPENHTMMLTIPFVIFGIFRYLYLIEKDQNVGAPEDVLMADRPLQVLIVLFGLTVLAIFYLSP